MTCLTGITYIVLQNQVFFLFYVAGYLEKSDISF